MFLTIYQCLHFNCISVIYQIFIFIRCGAGTFDWSWWPLGIWEQMLCQLDKERKWLHWVIIAFSFPEPGFMDSQLLSRKHRERTNNDHTGLVRRTGQHFIKCCSYEALQGYYDSNGFELTVSLSVGHVFMVVFSQWLRLLSLSTLSLYGVGVRDWWAFSHPAV